MALTPIKFSALPAMTALVGTEEFPGVQDTANGKATAEQIKDFTLSFAVAKAGDTMTGLLKINAGGLLVGPGDPVTTQYAGSNATPFSQVPATGANASFLMARFSNNASPGRIFFAKSRGTNTTSFTTISANDELGGFAFAGSDGTVFRDGAHIIAQAVAAPTSTYTRSRIRFETSNGTAGPLTKASIEPDGEFAMGTSYMVVIDSDRAYINRTTSLAGLSGFTHVLGKQLLVTDIGGGNGLVVSDGTNWRRAHENGTNRRTTDAAFTLTPLTDAPDQLCTGTLTADRAITLSTTNVYDGARFRITRTGAGAFNYTVAHNGGTKNIATDQWAEFVYFSALAAWQLAAAGSL